MTDNSSRPVLAGNALPVYAANTVDVGGVAQPVYLVNEDLTTEISEANDKLDVIDTNVDQIEALVNTIQQHLHSFERWYGASAGAVGPGLLAGLVSFRVTTSATVDTFGTAILVFDGTEEAPKAFQTLFDFHRLLITDVETAAVKYLLRFAFSLNGEASFADAVTNGHYTDVIVVANATNSDRIPLEIMSGQIPEGTKIWCAAKKSSGVGTAWVDFQMGLHWYPARPG